MRYTSISAIGAFTALSPASSDYLWLDPSKCSGGGDAPLRTTVEPAPGQDGALIFPAFDDAQIITLAGAFIITSTGDESGYFSAIDTIFASLKAALDTLKSAPGDLTSGDGTVKVWKYAPIADGWENLTKTVTFSVIVDVFA